MLSPVSLGIFLGLVVGKPNGITRAAAAVARAGWAECPASVTWRHLAGAGRLCGIGFTLSIFISYAAFEDPETLVIAKLSTIIKAVTAAIVGWTLLSAPAPRTPAGNAAS